MEVPTPAIQDPKKWKRNLSLPELFRDSPTDELYDNHNIDPAITSYVKLLIAKYVESLVKLLAEKEKELDEKNKRIHGLESHISERQEARWIPDNVTVMQILDQEQYFRRNSPRISGVVLEGGENAADKVRQISAELNINICDTDIDRAHLIGDPRKSAATGAGRQILVKFVRYGKRLQFLKAWGHLRESPKLRNIFINEYLTPTRYQAFKKLLAG